ncbi:MAG: CoA transferase subunit A [Acutalibacteraceae bacterium]
MKQKILSVENAIEHIKSGMTVMIGGFNSCGCPHELVDALSKSDVTDLTIVSSDASTGVKDVAKLFLAKKVKRFIGSHIGTNPEAGRQMITGECKIELIPQGTFVERIRCGGFGLGGVLTKSGLGTVVEENKRIINVDGEEWLLETPIHADVALISAAKSDSFGNLYYRGTTKNFNTIMATAADTVIAEVSELCKIGGIEKEAIHTPGIFIDHIVIGSDNP